MNRAGTNTQTSQQWLFDHKFILESKHAKRKKKEDEVPTFANVLMMAGGKANVPLSHWLQFLRAVAFDIKTGVVITYAEVEEFLEVVRRLAADLDHKRFDRFVSFEEVAGCIKVMQKVNNMYFPSGDNRGYLLKREDVVLHKAVPGKTVKQTLYSSGYHAIWPKILATGHNCRQVRQTWTDALSMRYKLDPTESPSWSTIVDDNIYATGLRMPQTTKLEPCKSCRGNDPSCYDCQGSGKNILGRVYTWEYRITQEGDLVPLLPSEKEDILFMLQECTIRAPFPVPRSDFYIPPDVPLATPLRSGKGGGKGPGRKCGGNGEKGLIKDNWIEFPKNSIQFEFFTRFLLTQMGFPYSSEQMLAPDRLYSNAKQTLFYMFTQCKYCQNMGGEHNSRKVYFIADSFADTMVQKCTCDCPIIRQGGGQMCKEYSSPPVDLTQEISKILFPLRKKVKPRSEDLHTENENQENKNQNQNKFNHILHAGNVNNGVNVNISNNGSNVKNGNTFETQLNKDFLKAMKAPPKNKANALAKAEVHLKNLKLNDKSVDLKNKNNNKNNNGLLPSTLSLNSLNAATNANTQNFNGSGFGRNAKISNDTKASIDTYISSIREFVKRQIGNAPRVKVLSRQFIPNVGIENN
jgi:hypothetical protein